MKNNEAIEIYVHIPFCNRKCDYCDFVSFVCKEDEKKAYFASLLKEIDYFKETVGNRPVVSCFFGGGTPTVPEASLVCEVLSKLKNTFNFNKDAEITLECNPNSESFEKLLMYKKAGFNRISIGLQSAVNEELKALGRLHDYEEFLKTYHDARKAGFENINIDLMSAIPKQTLESYRETLKKVVALNPEHISAYSLIIEEGTPFFLRYKDGHDLVSEDTEREMYYLTKEYLKENGYHRYEISNYSKEGFECIHNLGYWVRRDYLGLGISAASLINDERFTMHSDFQRFNDGDFSFEKEPLSLRDKMEEFMFLGLRLTKGVSKKEFSKLFLVSMEEVYGEALKKLSLEGLLINGDYVLLTDKGMDVANYCMSEFVS